MAERVLEINDLAVSFITRDGVTEALRGVSLDVDAGEIMCIVGESGSGKTVLLRSVMRLLPENGEVKRGSIKVCGREVTTLSEKEMRSLRGSEVSMILQDPAAAMDPTMAAGKQIAEVILKHKKVSKEEAKRRAVELMKDVGIENAQEMFKLKPHFFSGGMLQRCAAAAALAADAKLILADEPTTALDAIRKKEILDLFLDIREQTGVSIVMVTHDIGAASYAADRIAVMHEGRIVETGCTDEIMFSPKHQYTKMLIETARLAGTGKRE